MRPVAPQKLRSVPRLDRILSGTRSGGAAGRAQALPESHILPKTTGSASNLAWRCRGSITGSRFLLVDVFLL